VLSHFFDYSKTADPDPGKANESFQKNGQGEHGTKKDGTYKDAPLCEKINHISKPPMFMLLLPCDLKTLPAQ
jgi:hypothetical protein